jgi:hypothetical protein
LFVCLAGNDRQLEASFGDGISMGIIDRAPSKKLDTIH